MPTPIIDDELGRITTTDLAPGETRARGFDTSSLDVRVIRSPGDALLGQAYAHLWAEFGAAAEVEQQDVLARRLARNPQTPINGVHLLYQMILARDSSGGFAGVRDHTAIVRAGGSGHAIVHLSHVLVAPAFRSSGLAGWMRAWPVAAARACLAIAGYDPSAAITLVAEMEHPDPAHPERMVRLGAYQKAGFRKVDPAVVPYLQPDFRPAEEIDRTGVRPLPFGLIVRRIGREHEPSLTAADVHDMVAGLYAMYAADFRASDMAPLYESLEQYPAGPAPVRLVPPTA